MTKRRSNHHRCSDHQCCEQRSEGGFALVTTILIVSLMSLMAAAALTGAAGSVSIARTDDSYSAALGAADSGVDDVLYRLNAQEDTSFELAQNIWCYDQTALRATTEAQCPTTYNPALPPGAQGWVTIPDDNDTVRAQEYEYDVPANHQPNPSGTATTAGATGSSTLVFDVFGRTISTNGQQVTRAIRVVLSRSTFLNYGYFTNVETQDPQQYDLDPGLPGWPEFGPAWGSGITSWNGNATQAANPAPPALSAVPTNAYTAALQYCQDDWFGPNAQPDEQAQATAANIAISTDPRAIHSEQGPTPGPQGYSLNDVCTFTKWESGDTFYGPVRTNDALFIDGQTNFYGPVVVGTPCNMVPSADATESNCPANAVGTGTGYTPNNQTCVGTSLPLGCGDGQNVYWVDTSKILYNNTLTPNCPTCANPGPNFSVTPSYAAPVDLPPDNPNLEQEAESGGCLYEGMTYFDFLNTNPGTVYVYSPGTLAAINATPATFTLNSGCTANGTVTLSALTNPVLYVESPAGATSCLDSTGNDYTFGGLIQSNDYYTGAIAYYDSGNSNTVRYWSYTPSGTGFSEPLDPRAFACNNGDAWVGGVVSGRVTVGASNNVVVYQNLTYANTTYNINNATTPPSVQATGSDVIGLEPTNDVIIYHPVNCANWNHATWNATNNNGSCVNAGGNSATNDDGTDCPATGQYVSPYWNYNNNGDSGNSSCVVHQIDGAVLAFNGEYTAENYSFGPSIGTITEFGSVSEAYRGRLAGTSIGGGYGKEYIYDPRLTTVSPPSFLPPNLFNWSKATWSEVTGQVKPITSNTEGIPTSAPTTVVTQPSYTVPASPLQAPTITSPGGTSFTVGTVGNFQVSTTGSPTPTLANLAFSGCTPSTLPSGISFSASTGVLSGTPALGSGGVTYTLCLQANNVEGTATQTFTLTINNLPTTMSITVNGSSTSATIAYGATATLAESGLPAAATPAATGTVTFTSVASGATLCTATLPATSCTTSASLSGGVYTVTAAYSGDGNYAGTTSTNTVTLTVNQAPAITTGNSTIFTVGTAGSFQVAATGYPAPTFSDTSFGGCTPSTLPSGVTFSAAGLLSGTPGTGTTGPYTICVTASNSVLPNATQKFTLTVDQTPVITSASSTTFAAGVAGSFTATATGIPTPTFSNSSFGGCTPNLPSGVSFSNPGGVLSGTPGATAGGTYTVCINATNAVGTATQNFTLTVTQLPAVTSASSTAFTVGTAGSFQVTATGFPAPTFSNGFSGCSSTLPSGITLSAAGVLSGTPAAGAGGTYTACIKASNSVGSATQTFTLTVDQAPAITSASSTSFTVGTPGSFTATATGTPAATFSNAAFAGCAPSTLPSGITFSVAGALSGTPGSAGTYTICINATNVAGSATPQTFTLTVSKASPSLTVTGPASDSTDTAIAKTSITATLSGGGAPTGTITFTAYSNNNCTTQLSWPTNNTATVSGNNSYNPAKKYTPPGDESSLYWKASYGGDGNNSAVTSACST